MLSASSRTRLGLAIAAVGALALVPRPLLGPVGYVNGPLMFLMTPIERPARDLFTWLRGGDRDGLGAGENDPVVANLQAQLDEAKLELRQARKESDDLRTLIRDLSRGMELNPALAVKQINAPVIGFGADLSGGLLTVQAGRRENVTVNDIVTIRGINLMGRVVKTDERTCAVAPITMKGFGKLGCVILLDDHKIGPRCQIEATSDGLLTGRVMDERETQEANAPAEPPLIQPGMDVLLDDEHFPSSSRMLMVGRVIKVEPSPQQMQRQIVTVRPVMQDLAHVSEVIVRVPEESRGTSSAGVGEIGGGKP